MITPLRGISKVYRVLPSLILCIAIISFCSTAFASSANVTASVQGGAVVATVTGSFPGCTTCDQNGQNCTTNNSGSVSLYRDGGFLCSASGNGSASCTVTLDRGGLNGTHTFTGNASDCQGGSSSSTTVTIDNTPTVQVTNPGNGSVITSPFDITGVATFKPTLSAAKGTFDIYIDGGYRTGKYCYTENCTLSYKDLIGSLMDWPHGGPHTIKLLACGGGVCASEQVTVTVDKM